MSKDTAAIRDQLGNDPEIFPVLNADYDETVIVEEGASRGFTQELSDGSLIWGHPSLGIWGTGKWGDGNNRSFILGHPEQGILGSIKLGDRNLDPELVFVVNPDNTFIERFRFDTFKDLASTAYWDTTNYRFSMTNTASPIASTSKTALFGSVAYGGTNMTTATLECDETLFAGDSVVYSLSADGGSNWDVVSLGVPVTFTVSGNDLRIKAVFTGTGGEDTYIENVICTYQ